MNDWLHIQAVVQWLFGAVVALLVFIGRQQMKRIAKLEENQVSRAEVEKLHMENKERLDRIDDTTTRTHERIDQLYRDLIRQ